MYTNTTTNIWTSNPVGTCDDGSLFALSASGRTCLMIFCTLGWDHVRVDQGVGVKKNIGVQECASTVLSRALFCHQAGAMGIA